MDDIIFKKKKHNAHVIKNKYDKELIALEKKRFILLSTQSS